MRKLFSRWDSQTWAGLAFVILVPVIAHLLFSHLGFNPTDDGFMLAGSRRIIDGQIPHLDFISIRPAGSHLLHVPFVLFGGDYAIWISRLFAWFEFGCIAWAWTVIGGRSLQVFRSNLEKFVLALIAFCFSAHCFPIMVWHTLDALFVASVGIALCYKQSKLLKALGYLLIGMSVLFRLNFLLLVPASILLLDDWRQKRYWFIAVLPTACYVGYLAISGAMPDAVLQLTTYSLKTSLGKAVYTYIFNSGTAWGILAGYLATFMAHGKFNFGSMTKNAIWTRIIGILILFGIPLSVAGSLAIGGYFYIGHPSFAVFGTVIGLLLFFLYKDKKVTPLIRCGVMLLIVAWSVSLSIGYNTPALAMGPLVLFLVGCAISSCPAPVGSRESGRLNWSVLVRPLTRLSVRNHINILAVLLLIGTLITFSIARLTYIYREMPASHLTYDLGEVLLGGKLIKTNHNTYLFLKDLEVARDIAKDKEKGYAIIPDVAANWIKSSQPNPLSIDWPQSTELGRQELEDRIIGDLERHRGGLIVIVQKYQASSLNSGFSPLSDRYHIVQYVQSHWSKTGETQFFELYE